jgi:hypothetical protein
MRQPWRDAGRPGPRLRGLPSWGAPPVSAGTAGREAAMSSLGRDPGVRSLAQMSMSRVPTSPKCPSQTPVTEAFSACTRTCSSLNPRREPRRGDEPRAPSGPPATEQCIACTQHSDPACPPGVPEGAQVAKPCRRARPPRHRLKQQADGQGAKVTPYQAGRGGTWALAAPHPAAATASDSSSSTAVPTAATSARKKPAPRTRPAPHQHLTRRPTPDQKSAGDCAMTMSNEAEAG